MKTLDDDTFLQAKRIAAHRLSNVNPSTVGIYKRTAARLLRQAEPVAAACKPTLRVERASMRHLQLRAVATCKDREKFLHACAAFGWDANQTVQSVLENKWHYDDIPKLAAALTLNDHKPNTKRHILRELPQDWRQQFLAAIQSTTLGMREAFLLMAISGCRPEEVATTTVGLSEDGILTIHILSAKRRAHQRGDWREMRLVLPTWLGDCSGLLDPSVMTALRRITAKQIVDVARKVSRRAFPSLGERITASTFRHQFSSDLKSRGCTKREIALALGHSMIESQKTYGRPRFGYSEQIKIEINGSFEPSEPNGDRAKTFLDIRAGNDLPEP